MCLFQVTVTSSYLSGHGDLDIKGQPSLHRAAYLPCNWWPPYIQTLHPTVGTASVLLARGNRYTILPSVDSAWFLLIPSPYIYHSQMQHCHLSPSAIVVLHSQDMLLPQAQLTQNSFLRVAVLECWALVHCLCPLPYNSQHNKGNKLHLLYNTRIFDGAPKLSATWLVLKMF